MSTHTCQWIELGSESGEECGKPAVGTVWTYVCGYARGAALAAGLPEPSEDMWLCAEHYDEWNTI